MTRTSSNKIAYSNVAQINFKCLAIPGAGRNLEGQVARAFDNSASGTATYRRAKRLEDQAGLSERYLIDQGVVSGSGR